MAKQQHSERTLSSAARHSTRASSSSASSINVTPSSAGISGRPIQVVKVSDEHSFELVEDNLRSLLDREDVRDKQVVVVSVAGAFRKGKSFLLNFFIRYLNYIIESEDFSDSGWLDNQDLPLGGFAWRGGAKRETTGIVMWNQPFFMTTSEGVEVAVILLDTQGAFDSESTVTESATIFAMSTMLSSVQVYNLQANIQENDLQHLQLFTEYGRLASAGDDEGPPPFQSLLFLVRDWSYPYDHEYGMDGGNSLLANKLELSPSQHEELQMLRQQIRSCFETINCFLMPHPGLKVATNPKFDGRLADFENDFKEHLKDLVPYLLSKRHLVVKKISGNKVTGRDLIEYFKVYMKTFQGDTLPGPRSIMNATAEANNLVAVNAAKNCYRIGMEETCGGDPHPDQLKEAHERFMAQAMETFHGIKKMGGADLSVNYLNALENDIMTEWERYQQSNEVKRMLRTLEAQSTSTSFWTSLIFVGSCVFNIFYMLFGVFYLMFSLTTLVYLVAASPFTPIALLANWIYSAYTGVRRSVVTQLTEHVYFIWDTFLVKPARTMFCSDEQPAAASPSSPSTADSSSSSGNSSGSIDTSDVDT